MLSAKKPNNGCSILEHICEILIKTAATAIENPNFAAINGIIGFKKPVYISHTKCAKHNHNNAYLDFSAVIFISFYLCLTYFLKIKNTANIINRKPIK